MKKFYFFAVVLVIAVLAATLCGCNAADTVGKNMIASQSFNDDGFASLVFEKTDDSSATTIMSSYWSTTGTATGASVTPGTEGISIDTSTGGYATVSQSVNLRANSYYKVSYTFTMTKPAAYDITKSYDGLFVGFLEDSDFNKVNSGEGEDVKRVVTSESTTDGSEHFYVKVGSMHEATIAIFLGNEDCPVNATAVVKSIKLERVTKSSIAEGELVMNLVSDQYGKAIEYNVVYVVLGAIGTLLIGYGIYMVRARAKAKEELAESDAITKLFKSNKMVGFVTVAGVALLIRTLILAIQAGLVGGATTAFYGYDMATSFAYGSWLGKNGTQYFFEYNGSAAFMPIALYLQALAGAIANACPNPELAYASFIKVFAILADLGTSVLIYIIISKKRGNLTAAIYACFYALLPAVFAMSSAFGAMDSVAVFFVVLTFYFILEKKYIESAAAMFVASMVAPIALIVVPFVLLYAGLLCYNSIKDKKYIDAIKVVGCMGVGVLLFFLISLPFSIEQIKGGDGSFAFTSYVSAVKGLNVYSSNAFNFQGMIGNNFKAVSTESTFITIVFVIFIVAVLAVPYYKSRSRLNLVGITAVGALAYWYFCNNLSQDGLLIVLPLLLIYAGMIEDKRLFAMTTLLGALAFINSSYFYLVTDVSDTSLTHISYDGNPVMYIMGAFMLVYIIALVIIGYDVIVSRKYKEQLSLKVPYGQYVASVATNMLISSKNAYFKSKNFCKSVVQAIKESIAERKAKKLGQASDENEENK